MKVLLIGAGEIAREYAKSLHARGIDDIHVVSRTPQSARAFAQDTGAKAIEEESASYLRREARSFDGVIVATPIETLLAYTRDLVDCGARRILVEKPVALSARDLDPIIASHPGAPVMVAFNRLFFPSVEALRLRLGAETLRSAEFSFTEWVHRISPEKYGPTVMRRWGAANCIHVIATAFDLIGLPKTIHGERAGHGDIPWHDAGSVFTGSGKTVAGVPFSYGADWGSAGRWSITVRTDRGSYRLEPMESLSFCPKGSVAWETIVPNWAGDTKCGFNEMLTHWLTSRLPDPRFSLARTREHLAAVGAMLYGEEL